MLWLRCGRPSRARAAALAIACLGCGDATISGSLEEARVSGVVRLHGKPVDNGLISFNVANVNRPSAAPREAPIGKDGSYSVTTLLGDNSILVTCKQLRTAKNSRYADAEHFLDVKPGDNSFDIDIPPRVSSAR